MQNNADIYILEDPKKTKCYNNIIDICDKIRGNITINKWHHYDNNPALKNVNQMKHCDAAIDFNYSNKRLFILLEITALVHYCDEEDKFNNTRDFFYKVQVINNNTKIVPIVCHKRVGKSKAAKDIKIGKNKVIFMKYNETLIQILSDYNLM